MGGIQAHEELEQRGAGVLTSPPALRCLFSNTLPRAAPTRNLNAGRSGRSSVHGQPPDSYGRKRDSGDKEKDLPVYLVVVGAGGQEKRTYI